VEPFCSLKKIVKKNGEEIVVCDDIRSYLLGELQRIQDEDGYISDERMQDVAERFDIHPVEVYSVVTFYSFLTTERKGKSVIRVSGCITSVMKGAEDVIEAFERRLGIRCGQTTKDGRFTLEKTSCLGMCDKAPAIMVDEKLVGPVKPKQVDALIDELDRDPGRRNG